MLFIFGLQREESDLHESYQQDLKKEKPKSAKHLRTGLSNLRQNRHTSQKSQLTNGHI